MKSNKYRNSKRQHTKKHRKQSYSKLYKEYMNLGKQEELRYKPLDFVVSRNPNITDISKKILSSILKTSTYSTLGYYFIPNIKIEKQDEYVAKLNTGNCVYFAKRVLKELEKQKIKGYLIPSTILKSLQQPNFPLYAHCVVIVKTETHFIIYEPAFYILEPIFINLDGNPTTYFIDVYEKDWTYKYDESTNKINVYENGEAIFYYYLVNVLNPSTSISYPVNIHNQRLPIVKYDVDSKQKQAHLSIRLDNNCLEGYSKNHEGDGWFEKHDLSKLNEMPVQERKPYLSSWAGLSDHQCNSLNCNKNDLMNKIIAIMQIQKKKELP